MSHHPGGRYCHQRGFTLIELMVVFAIMALMIGIVPAKFEAFQESARYRDTIRAMVSGIRLAQSIATSQARETQFVVDLSSRQFGIDAGKFRGIPDSLQVRVTAANQELQPTKLAVIRFLPDGGSSGGSIDVIRASGAGTRIRIDWLSGQVTQTPLHP